MKLVQADKNIIKYILNRIGINVSRYKNSIHDEMVSFKPNGKSHGNVILALIIEPFLLKENEEISNSHTNHQESINIAKIFLELGYAVDVISKLRGNFLPAKNYTFYVNLRTNFTRIGSYLNKDCIKIVHLDVSHWSFSNRMALDRVKDIQERRGIALSSIRHITPNYAIEYCDYATILGNDFTKNTYQYAGKTIYKTRLGTCFTYEEPNSKKIEKCRKSFLWFGSSGFVHKGLDLLLEIFTDMPDYKLVVCGPIDEDPDFKNEYYKELYETSNIETKGWMDVNSDDFLEVIENCIAVVFPSCAEGSNGGVITCMQAGIIPIVSRQTGIDIDPSYGISLQDCSINEIKNRVEDISKLPEKKLQEMTREAWQFARSNHTRDIFHQDYKNAVLDIVKKENEKRKTKIKVNVDDFQ